MSKESKLQVTKEEKDMLNKVFWRTWFLGGSMNPVNYLGFGYTQCLVPVIKTLFKDEEARKEALKRNDSFFNSTPEMAPLVLGLNASMEKANSKKMTFDADAINGLKASLMGPISGIGDSLILGVLRVIAAGLTIPLAMQGNILAPILFLLIYHVPTVYIRYMLLFIGYTAGESFLSNAFKSGAFEKLKKAFIIVGLIMVGAMTAQMVSVPITAKIVMGAKQTIDVQKILDSIMPGLVPLGATLLVFKLIRKKVNVTTMLLAMFVIGILGALIGLF